MSIEAKKIEQDDALLALIKKMVETPGPSGQEQLIRAAILEEIQGSADEIRTDAMGNLIARKGSKQPNGLRIMISAHMDEIGLMVTHVDEDGFVRFISIGGVSPLTCIGGRVIFMNGQRGVIGCERLEPNALPTLEKLFIDVGATSREDCPVKVGDVCGFERPFLDLGKHLVAKSMDNRISVVVAIDDIDRAVRAVHTAFGLDASGEAVVYAGTGR